MLEESERSRSFWNVTEKCQKPLKQHFKVPEVTWKCRKPLKDSEASETLLESVRNL